MPGAYVTPGSALVDWRRPAWERAITSDPPSLSERLIRVANLLYVLGLLGLVAGLVGAVTRSFPLWWGLLAAGLCAVVARVLARHAFGRLIPPARTPEAKRARSELLRRFLADDPTLEAELEALLQERGGDDAPEGEEREAPEACI